MTLSVYARNRVFRILPLYAVAVVGLLAVGAGQPGRSDWLDYLTMTQHLSRDTGQGITELASLWSVVVEIHFYILLPLIAWALALLSRRSIGRAALVLLVLGGLSLALRIATVEAPSDPDTILFWRLNLPANFLFFIPGMLLALLRLHWQASPASRLSGPLGRADLWIAAAIVPVVLFALVSYTLAALMAVTGFLLVGACVLPLQAGPLTRLLDAPALAWVGVRSYSVYVWHVAVLVAAIDLGAAANPWTALTLIGLPATLLVAAVSYQLAEAPFLRLRRAWSPDAASRSIQPPTVAATPTR